MGDDVKLLAGKIYVKPRLKWYKKLWYILTRQKSKLCFELSPIRDIEVTKEE